MATHNSTRRVRSRSAAPRLAEGPKRDGASPPAAPPPLHTRFPFLIPHDTLLNVSDGQAVEIAGDAGHYSETILHGMTAIGVMLASIDAEDMGARHVGPAGMLLELLGNLAWELSE